MRPIDRFILHVAHNWVNELNEAYNEGTIKKFIEKFRDEADDFNIKISDEQLKKYIERFDDLKNSPKITEKDLNKWTIGQLIRLVTSYQGVEVPEKEKEENTPDVVYNEGPFTIWNGAKKDNCITYGRGEKWCITRPGNTNWDNYRYGTGEPTFYLAKNRNLSDSDPLSFVAIQVLNNGQYKYTNRNNSPGMSSAISWSELVSRIPWLNEIPNIKTILKYIPLSNQEKANQVYKNRPISFREWEKEPFSVKKQYLIARGQSQGRLFGDISDDDFISNYLAEYPQLISVFSDNPELIDPVLLLNNLGKIPKNERESITSNLRKKIDKEYLLSNKMPFDVKKLLVKLNKWDLKNNERLYVTKDGSTIVLLELGSDDITIDLYQDRDNYSDIKLNQRTSKYLLDYSELDKIPLKLMLNLVSKGIIDKNIINSIIKKAEEDPNSALIVEPTEDGKIIVDSNTFSAFKLDSDGKLSGVPFKNEEVQNVISKETSNKSLQQNSLNLFKTDTAVPSNVDKNNLQTIINKIPYSQRTIPIRSENNAPGVLLTVPDSDEYFVMPTSLSTSPSLQPSIRFSRNNIDIKPWSGLNNDEIDSYFKYLRATNQAYTAEQLKNILKKVFGNNEDTKKAFIEKNPPVSTDSYLQPLISNNIAYLVNVNNPRESFKISDRTGKLLGATLPANIVNRLRRNVPAPAVGAAEPAVAAAPGVRRRGRPVGGGQPRAAAPVAAGDIAIPNRMEAAGLLQGFNALPISVRRRINVNNAVQAPIVNNRGASRRNNLLGAAGRVSAVYEIGDSAIYIIDLANNTQVASVVVQPGNIHYLVTPQGAYGLASPSDLRSALQRRGLAEDIKKAAVKLYLAESPDTLEETIDMIKQLQSEIKVEPTASPADPYVFRRALLHSKTNKPVTKLNLKIGKYNLSGEEDGVELTWDEGKKFLSTITRRNAENLFNKLNTTPENVYIGMVPDRQAYSYYITGTYNNEGIAIARKETSSPAAGQTYLVTPKLKKQLTKLGSEYNVTDLEEIKIVPTGIVRILPKEDIDIIDQIVDGKIDGNYSFSSDYEPDTKIYSQKHYCVEGPSGDESQCKAIKTLFKKYPYKTKFVSNDYGNEVDPAPGAPSNSFSSLIEIKDNEIIVHRSNMNTKKGLATGWFDINGKYHHDTRNFDKKGNYIGRRLEEIKIVPIGMSHVLSKDDVKLIEILTDSFGEGDSGFDLHEPMSATYDLNLCDEDWNDEEKCEAVKTLLAKYPNGGTFVSNDVFGNNFPCPGAPPNSYDTCIEINTINKYITVSAPYLSTDGEYSVGWFDINGKYYPDTKNFNEDGDYIENA